MFINTRIQDIGGTAIRHSIPVGAVFKYQEGRGDSYLALGTYKDFFMGCKLESVNKVANFTITPLESANADRNCDITGVFGFLLDMQDTPEIAMSTRDFSFGSVISLPKDLDDDGNSHLYITFGNRPERHVSDQLLLRLTGQDTTCIFKPIPAESMIAVRGTAALNVEYLERKA